MKSNKAKALFGGLVLLGLMAFGFVASVPSTPSTSSAGVATAYTPMSLPPLPGA